MRVAQRAAKCNLTNPCGRFAPSGFALRARILSRFAPSNFALALLSRFAPSSFALRARYLPHNTPRVPRSVYAKFHDDQIKTMGARGIQTDIDCESFRARLFRLALREYSVASLPWSFALCAHKNLQKKKCVSIDFKWSKTHKNAK